VVREGMIVPPHHLVAGVPGVIKRELSAREREVVARTPERYLELARRARLSLAGAGG
jgi:carbonic anhydrase/acetyltransferase-like protein (isoleucine patch superfamily)